MRTHAKGAKNERELVKMLKEAGLGTVRIAGSGKMDKAPDIISGKPGRLLILECKSSKKPAIYVNPEEAKTVLEYAKKFGGEAWYAFRFSRTEWKFVPALTFLQNSKVTPNHGISFSKFIQK